jgi:hypothetical protein
MVREAELCGERGEMIVGGFGFRGREEVGDDDRALGIKSIKDGGEVFQREFNGGVLER